MASPVGIEILKGSKPKWKVGKQLGVGACATVHSLENIDGTPTEFAIKLTPLPKKKTKKGNSAAETNANILYFESVFYHNHVQDLTGTYVPDLPPSRGPPGVGEIEGYKFLVIEKMSRPLVDVVTMLREGRKRNDETILFGPIATRLLSCIEAIHERKHVVVDVKSDNFMLGPGDDRKLASDQIASRIRILDFALVQNYSSVGSHRPNDGGKGLVGTPLYVSLNVHDGDTPSRRDDLEALGYVIAELLLKIVSGDSSKQLPWSLGKSDQEIYEIKKEQVTNPDSDFYRQLGGQNVANTFFTYLSEVRGYTYKKKPDYESLKTILQDLNPPISERPAARNTRKRQSTRIRSDARPRDEPEQTGPPITGKRTTRSQTRAAAGNGTPSKIRKDDSYMDTDVADIPSDEEHFQNAQQDADLLGNRPEDDETFVTAMEWEMTDENQEPSNDSKPAAIDGLTIVVESGPKKGHTVNLLHGVSETLIVGSNPSIKPGQQALMLPDDAGIGDSHIQIDLKKGKRMKCVLVSDLGSSLGTFVGSEKIPNGKNCRVFRGQTVRVGDSILSVQSLDPQKAAKTSGTASSGETRRTRRQGNTAGVSPEAEDSQPEPELPRLKRKGIKLTVVEGPHKGYSFEWEHGKKKSLTLGSRVSTSGDDRIGFDRDSSLKATHAQLELIVQKKLTAVMVTDKSNGDTMINRGKVKKSRAFINDHITIGDTVLQIQAL